VIGPRTLAAWLRALLREHGVRCRLDGNGRVRVKGPLRHLPAAERAALFASGEQVRALLEGRARRRSVKGREQEQQHRMATAEPQRPRKVIGQVVLGGGRTRSLFEDETTAIPAQRCRVLAVVPYGWRK
jgi:hypothetical protein